MAASAAARNKPIWPGCGNTLVNTSSAVGPRWHGQADESGEKTCAWCGSWLRTASGGPWQVQSPSLYAVSWPPVLGRFARVPRLLPRVLAALIIEYGSWANATGHGVREYDDPADR